MFRYLIFFAFVFAGPGVLQGQQGAPGGAVPLERLELVRMWRLVEELRIGEEQAARLFPFWSEHRRQSRGIQRERKQAANELKHLLDQNDIPDEVLMEKMGKIRAIDKKKEDLELIFREKMVVLLSVRQRARLLLFQERFRKDLQDFLKEAGPRRQRREEARERGFWGGADFWK